MRCAVLFCAGLQHPSGGLKQVALRENQLIRKGPSTLLYRSDTAPGSSGSPCFIDAWQVWACLEHSLMRHAFSYHSMMHMPQFER
jgi:hypothetical protein